jgi:hypothetical protein
MDMKEHQSKVKELVDGIDEFFSQSECNTVDALNATSIISTMIAKSLGMSRKDYLKDLGNMFDRTIKEPEKDNEH